MTQPEQADICMSRLVLTVPADWRRLPDKVQAGRLQVAVAAGMEDTEELKGRSNYRCSGDLSDEDCRLAVQEAMEAVGLESQQQGLQDP